MEDNKRPVMAKLSGSKRLVVGATGMVGYALRPQQPHAARL